MSWELDLQALERAIALVNAEYDAFLYGSASKPPVESRKNVDRLIRELGRSEPESAADRYRFSTIQGRWNTLIERWERLQGEKEAGKRPGLYGRFGSARPEKSATAAAPNTAPSRSVDSKTPPAASDDSRRELFEKYLAARKARGESAEGLNFERFADSLERETERVKERFGGAEIEFDVAERDGRVKLVARRKT
ncbi:MAG: MXAN_5187 C-terminal domain-containing protein [Acidobacteriota bacterium]